MPTVLIIGATRGLGAALATHYISASWTVYGTSRSSSPPDKPSSVSWIPSIDLTSSSCASSLVSALPSALHIDLLIISAGHFDTETLAEPSWESQVRMYTTSSIAPVFLVSALHKGKNFAKGGKVIVVSSESGSIGLRHESEGGGNYGHHASKAALNMVGKLLSLDLKDTGVTVGIVHPGFMRSEMTKGVGFDKFWDDGGAVQPEEAAKSLAEWIDGFDLSKTGQYWAPRGPGDIGTAEQTLGPKGKLPTPLQLPW